MVAIWMAIAADSTQPNINLGSPLSLFSEQEYSFVSTRDGYPSHGEGAKRRIVPLSAALAVLVVPLCSHVFAAWCDVAVLVHEAFALHPIMCE